MRFLLSKLRIFLFFPIPYLSQPLRWIPVKGLTSAGDFVFLLDKLIHVHFVEITEFSDRHIKT